MFAVNLHPVSDRASGLLRPPFSIAVLNFLCAFFFFTFISFGNFYPRTLFGLRLWRRSVFRVLRENDDELRRFFLKIIKKKG